MFKFLSFSILLVAAILHNAESQQVVQAKKRIVGGIAASINTLPYQAQLLRDGVQICGGSIISESWILTAAHCIEKTVLKRTIITGSDRVSKGGQHHEIEKIFVHPNYNDDTNDNDIALIKLQENIEFHENQLPIDLGTRVPQTGEIMTISGFGLKAEDGKFATTLEVTTVPVVDFETCKAKYVADPITENMFCAGEGPTDACQGDSGGPAVINDKLVGVVSAGMKCGDTFYPGLYTRVANYLQWIDETMKYQAPKKATAAGGIFHAHKKYQPKTVLGNIISKVLDTIII